MKNKDLILVLLRLFLGYIFFSAGVCKLAEGGFGQLIGPPWLEEALEKHSLGLFAQVVAISQVTCGALLLSQRFSLLGTIMLVPMNVAILAVTVSMNWAGTPYINAFFLALNLLMLLLERQKFSFLFQPNATHRIKPNFTDKIGQHKLSWLGLLFCLLIMFAARYNLALTNSFAVVIFASFAFTILSVKGLHHLDKFILGLPFVAMLIVTFGNLSTLAVPLHVTVLALEAILLILRIYLSTKEASATKTLVPDSAEA